ncbi:MAG TPA: hypothetical protein PL182_14000, partial [Pseudobdellovibrionaceae bacterium]|nr:hypothetical protein [Pseudobdellovibrionaceae bacterium]
MNNPRKDVLVLGVLVLAAVIGFYIRSQNDATPTPPPTTVTKQESIKQVPPTDPSQPDSSPSAASSRPAVESPSAPSSPEALQMARVQKDSLNAIRDFKDTAG